MYLRGQSYLALTSFRKQHWGDVPLRTQLKTFFFGSILLPTPSNQKMSEKKKQHHSDGVKGKKPSRF